MIKGVLLLLLVATVAIPAVAARDGDPRRGLKKAIFAFLMFDLAYMAFLLYVYLDAQVAVVMSQ
jgi:hypothetical protein